MRINIQTPAMLQSLSRRVSEAGGQALLVGGAVIDTLNERQPKDWDIEVFGLSFDDLAALFTDKGPKMVGREFGILKLSASECDGLDIDLNVPRRDNHIGAGHKDLMVDLDPGMTFEEACRRRDFTINAMAVDLSTGELVDPFGGMADLGNGILRATDPVLFVQDPLRALRAMQLLARKAKVVDPSTMSIIRGMVDSFQHLASERVHEEWRKLLLKADHPSVGLEFLRDSGWLVHFPELQILIGCEQHPEWHPEGDVWTHSLHTVDSAAWVRENGNLPDEWVEAFMFGTMLHDLGKPATTVTPQMVSDGLFPKERLWTAWGHDRVGMPCAKSFLQRMTNNKKLIEKTESIVGEHMQPFHLWQGEARKASWKRLHNKLRLDVLGWMCKCDSCGGPARHIGDPDLEHETSAACWDHFDEFGDEPIAPLLQGRHLVAAGLKPGPQFSVALAAAFEQQMEGVDDIDSLLKVATAAF